MSRTAAVDSNESRPGPVNRTWAILLISIAGLYLELLLIRWIDVSETRRVLDEQAPDASPLSPATK